MTNIQKFKRVFFQKPYTTCRVTMRTRHAQSSPGHVSRNREKSGRESALANVLSKKRRQERREIGQRRHMTVIEDDSPVTSDDDDVFEEEEGPSGIQERRRMSGEHFVKYADRYHTGDGHELSSLSSDLDDFIATSDSESSSSAWSGEENSQEDVNECRKYRDREPDSQPNATCKRQKRHRKQLISSSDDDDGCGWDSQNGVSKSVTIENEEEEEDQQQQESRMVTDRIGKVVVRKKKGPMLRSRERKGHDMLSPLERIRDAQRKMMDGQDSDVDPDASCSLLTDEGEPSSSASVSGSLDQEEDVQDAWNEVAVPCRHDAIWRQEAEKLGINKMSEEEAFRAYIEYLFICSIDPQYENQVKQSGSHRLLYSQAIRKIEYLIIQAQDYIHSESWRSCDALLLESMERHAFVERLTRDEPHKKGDEDECAICAACGKGNGWIQVEFKCEKSSKDSFLAGERDMDMMLSQKYALASPIYQRNRGYVEKSRCIGECEEDSPLHRQNHELCSFFWLGSTCVKRILIFHALFHFRQHCLTFLRRHALRVMKTSKEEGGVLSMDAMLDAVLNDRNHERMYTCFTSLLRVAESYQIAGGSEKHLLGREAPQCDPPQYALLYGDFTDVDVSGLDEYLKDV